MMQKTNCWQAKQCGREVGGKNVEELGICPAATESRLDGTHGGCNGGRACWVVAGTFCGGAVQGSFAAKCLACTQCDFYLAVRKEEGESFQNAGELMRKLK